MSEQENGREDRSQRWRRREQRRRSERNRMKKHGATTARVYRDAVLKRLHFKKRR